MSPAAEELLLEFLYQKKELERHAGVKHTRVPNWHRAVHLWGSHMDAIGTMVDGWNIPPAVIMQAAFARAIRDRHPDGPQINMLKSSKYLIQALSVFLDLPQAAIIERRSMETLMQIMDKEFSEVTFPSDLLAFTIENDCFRYVEARARGEILVAAALAPEVLRRISEDRRLEAWLSHRGFPYIEIAKHYNNTISYLNPGNPILPDEPIAGRPADA